MTAFQTLTAGAIAVVLTGQPAIAVAQTADDLFDQQVVHEIRVFMHSRDLAELRARYLENVYYVADMEWNGRRVRNVAVRVRGHGSRSATKPSLRIDFDRYVTDQRFLGLRSLVLQNRWQDPSMLRETLAMAMFARMGQPASRESFCRMYINNTYYGLYAIVEAVEPEYLTRVFGANAGYLYEYHYLDPYYGQELENGIDAYKSRFEPRTHELEADSILYAPIQDLVREVNQPIDAVWRDRVGQYLDLNAFVTYIAIDTFLSDNDGLLGYNGMNNFYLYRPADSTVHRFIPWDKDLAVGDIDHAVFTRVEENALARGALAFPDLRALYLDVLEQCARSALQDDWFAGEVLRYSTLIRPPALEDRLKPFTNIEFEETVQHLFKYAAERPAFVLQGVAAARARD